MRLFVGNLWSFEYCARRVASEAFGCAHELASLQHRQHEATRSSKFIGLAQRGNATQNSFGDADERERVYPNRYQIRFFREKWYALQVFKIGFALKIYFCHFNWLCFIFFFVVFFIVFCALLYECALCFEREWKKSARFIPLIILTKENSDRSRSIWFYQTGWSGDVEKRKICTCTCYFFSFLLSIRLKNLAIPQVWPRKSIWYILYVCEQFDLSYIRCSVWRTHYMQVHWTKTLPSDCTSMPQCNVNEQRICTHFSFSSTSVRMIM